MLLFMLILVASTAVWPGNPLNKYELQHKQHRKNIHHRRDLLEVAADHVHKNVGDHSEQDAV